MKFIKKFNESNATKSPVNSTEIRVAFSIIEKLPNYSNDISVDILTFDGCGLGKEFGGQINYRRGSEQYTIDILKSSNQLKDVYDGGKSFAIRIHNTDSQTINKLHKQLGVIDGELSPSDYEPKGRIYFSAVEKNAQIKLNKIAFWLAKQTKRKFGVNIEVKGLDNGELGCILIVPRIDDEQL